MFTMRLSELPRPSPERLLKQVQAEENKRWGAKLKIFLGYAPGVGKSYRMLDEARGATIAGKTWSWAPFKGSNPKTFRDFCGNWS